MNLRVNILRMVFIRQRRHNQKNSVPYSLIMRADPLVKFLFANFIVDLVKLFYKYFILLKLLQCSIYLNYF